MMLKQVLVFFSLLQLAWLQSLQEGDCVSRHDEVREELDEVRKEFEASRKGLSAEVEALKSDLQYWQNTTLSILRKCALEGQVGESEDNKYNEELQDVQQKVENVLEEVSLLRNMTLQGAVEMKDLQADVDNILTLLQNNSIPGDAQCSKDTKLTEIEDKLEEISQLHEDRHSELLQVIAESGVNNSNKGSFHNPATSCAQIKSHHPDSSSAHYWIRSPESGYASLEYCDMDRITCGGGRGWMRVAHMNMDIPSHHCPHGFREISSPVRACGRPSGKTCVSVTFSVQDIPYSKVIGKVIGYQYKSPDGFRPYYDHRDRTIEDIYVDGVSITYGKPRNHIWTFVAALDETRSGYDTCPCTRSGATYTGVVPPFIGNDYSCETGSRYSVASVFYDEDPLWDKQGCGSGSTCCDGPDFFCKTLPGSTNENIELRLCANLAASYEDTPLKHIELYVQ